MDTVNTTGVEQSRRMSRSLVGNRLPVVDEYDDGEFERR